ncbi:PTS sugar transporter subunit IIC [Xylocopilactobacillus apicola]|uniref:Permease IIC component n=1 Tax=Xylocopilactobacillus apicola TaxID=2932184 RepID=A0AAU9DB66_9LACO|nr:PTS sugar transporter subunit IIC [Xylocopilactobacillus apicola]BDR59651.1 permease IIC component [Xylocopilactobacillus apicola]
MQQDNKSTESFMERYLMPVAIKLSGVKALIAMRDGIALSMPLIMAGSFFMIIGIIPITSWTNWVQAFKINGVALSDIFNKITNGSFGLLGMLGCFGIASSLAEQYKTDGKSAGVIAISSFFVVTPSVFTAGKEPLEGMPYGFLGSKGLFIAIIIGLTTGWIFQWFINHNIQIKMPETVPPAVSRSFSALIPGAVIIAIWGAIYAGLQWTNLGNVHELLLHFLQKPLGLLGDTIGGTLAVVFLNSAFWFVGIHGGSVVNNIISPIWLMNTDANRVLYKAHNLDLSHGGHIISSPFIDNFVFMGGGGATIGLVLGIAILVFMRKSSKQLEVLAPLTIVPGIFNINEPTMFGLPVVLNVTLLIPYILAPMINVVTTYFVMKIGLVPLCDGAVIPWSTPPIISGFLATNSINGSILQIVNIILDILVYLPFLMTLNKTQRLEEAGKLEV